MFEWSFRRRGSKSRSYKVELRRGSRECVTARYSENGRQLDFAGEFVGKKWKQINLAAPKELNDAELPRVIANLAEYLRKRNYEYVVFRTGEPIAIPEVEQANARAELREIGLEPILNSDGSIKFEKLPTWSAPSKSEAQERAVKMMRLVLTLRGKRAPIEVLAKSDAAVVDFI